MRITALAIRNFRNLANVALDGCSGVNTLIGKNNAGKSNILSAIDIAIGQLKSGQITSEWPVKGRPTDEFFDRNTTKQMQIGFQLHVGADTGDAIRRFISQETEGIDLALDRIDEIETVSVICAGRLQDKTIARYIEEIAFGPLDHSKSILRTLGRRIFQLPEAPSQQIISAERNTRTLQNELRLLDSSTQELISRHSDKGESFIEYAISQATQGMSRDLARQVSKAFAESDTASDDLPLRFSSREI